MAEEWECDTSVHNISVERFEVAEQTLDEIIGMWLVFSQGNPILTHPDGMPYKISFRGDIGPLFM